MFHKVYNHFKPKFVNNLSIYKLKYDLDIEKETINVRHLNGHYIDKIIKPLVNIQKFRCFFTFSELDDSQAKEIKAFSWNMVTHSLSQL